MFVGVELEISGKMESIVTPATSVVGYEENSDFPHKIGDNLLVKLGANNPVTARMISIAGTAKAAKDLNKKHDKEVKRVERQKKEKEKKLSAAATRSLRLVKSKKTGRSTIDDITQDKSKPDNGETSKHGEMQCEKEGEKEGEKEAEKQGEKQDDEHLKNLNISDFNLKDVGIPNPHQRRRRNSSVSSNLSNLSNDFIKPKKSKKDHELQDDTNGIFMDLSDGTIPTKSVEIKDLQGALEECRETINELKQENKELKEMNKSLQMEVIDIFKNQNSEMKKWASTYPPIWAHRHDKKQGIDITHLGQNVTISSEKHAKALYNGTSRSKYVRCLVRELFSVKEVVEATGSTLGAIKKMAIRDSLEQYCKSVEMIEDSFVISARLEEFPGFLHVIISDTRAAVKKFQKNPNNAATQLSDVQWADLIKCDD